METPRDDQLAEDLRALRPTPRPEFAAELDERAAAGFPRRSRMPRLSPGRLRTLSPRRLLLPAGGFAVAVALVTAVLVLGQSQETRHLDVATPGSGGAAGAAERLSAPEQASPKQFSGGDVPVQGAAGEASTETEAPGGLAGTETSASPRPDVDARGVHLRDRAVERSAEIVLGAEPADVGDDAAEVFEAVRAHDGIVLRSSTRQGAAGRAGARFEVLIPSAQLGDALAAFSAIDEVRSRREATADITAPTVEVSELLEDSKARIDSLLGQLAEAEVESEREAVEVELRQERRHRARLRSSLESLERRADLSRVSLRIETGGSESPTDDGSWGIGSALDDAGRILALAAAVLVIALAVLAPVALIALLAWLAYRAWIRRERRRVFG
jgi:hypothetical protein